jgi:hypothetical protein
MTETNSSIILDSIPFTLDTGLIISRLHLHGDTRRFHDVVQNLIELVTPLARPRALYKVSRVTGKCRDTVEIDGVKFTSQVLRVNVDSLDTVFPFVATVGPEVETLSLPAKQNVERYCLDIIKSMIVMSALGYLRDYLMKQYSLSSLAVMNPGEIESWPLSQQYELFKVLGNVKEAVGVELTATGTMSPVKSRSGIFFPSESGYLNCRLCRNQKCPGRQAAYSPEIVQQYQEKYRELSGTEK